MVHWGVNGSAQSQRTFQEHGGRLTGGEATGGDLPGGVDESEDSGGKPGGGKRAVEVAGALASPDDLFESGGASGYDIPAQARRVGAVLDRLGPGRLTVAGHSMGCMVATALAEQRPDKVAALALIDMGPSLDAMAPEGLLVRLLLARFPGPLLWRLRNEPSSRPRWRCLTGPSRGQPVDPWTT